MIRNAIVILLVIILSSCSHKITRFGYKANESAPTQTYNIPIKYESSVSNMSFTAIGSIDLGDTGFSTNCTESDATRILEAEASKIGADLIIITGEERPDLWSSCYRVSADFVKINGQSDNFSLKSDNEFSANSIEAKSLEDSNKQTAMIVGTIVGGIVAFFVGRALAK